MATPIRRFRQFMETWRRAHHAGCCGCGAIVVRYVYTGEWKGQIVSADARCEACGPITHGAAGLTVREVPAVDYGRDVEVTVGDLEDDVAATARGERLRERCPVGCAANAHPHVHAKPKKR